MTSTESGRTCFEFLVLRLNVSRLNVSSCECRKNNKQAGPDGIAMELFKWMDAEKQNFLLNLINHRRRHKQAPENIFRARVVSIFKIGDTDFPKTTAVCLC